VIRIGRLSVMRSERDALDTVDSIEVCIVAQHR